MKSIPDFFISGVHFSVTNFFYEKKRLYLCLKEYTKILPYFSDQKETLGLLNYKRNKEI